MEREFIAHHIKEDNSGLEHLIALTLPKKYSEDYSKHSTGRSEVLDKALVAFEDAFRSTRRRL